MEIKHSNGTTELWSREDLEGVDWNYLERDLPDDAEVPGIYDGHLRHALARITARGEEMPCGDLMAAAPNLALACLDAHYLADRVAEGHAGTPLGDTAFDLLRALDAALALAGVQP